MVLTLVEGVERVHTVFDPVLEAARERADEPRLAVAERRELELRIAQVLLAPLPDHDRVQLGHRGGGAAGQVAHHAENPGVTELGAEVG